MTVQDDAPARRDPTRASRYPRRPPAATEPATQSCAPATDSTATDTTAWVTPTRTPKAAVLVARTLRAKIATGALSPGDHLPHEAELMRHFDVSRGTLREAVRMLESDGLIEVRHGARTGALVTMPGPDAVARPAAFLLQVAGATLADVYTARAGVEPIAANLLAGNRRTGDVAELHSMVAEGLPHAWDRRTVNHAVPAFHRRLVELSGNATLAVMAGMIFELTQRCVPTPRGRSSMTRVDFEELLNRYRQLLSYIDAGDGTAAASFWHDHLDLALKAMPRGVAQAKIRDLIG